MFSFLKKKENIEKEDLVSLSPEYSEDEIIAFKQEISQRESILEHHKNDASFFEKLGLLYGKVDNIEKAIDMLEKSLSIELSMGDGYKKLMSFYNQKRKEAAVAHDDELIEYYMDKMDEMRNIAKKVILTAK